MVVAELLAALHEGDLGGVATDLDPRVRWSHLDRGAGR